MTEIVYRRMRFDIDDTVPFQWNPANPASGLQANMISFIAVGFERYIVLAVKEALKAIDDPMLAEEARTFLAQESQHAAAHRRHVNALIAQYPDLQQVIDGVIALYEELFDTEPLAFHLAYIASLEATFPPLFSFLIDHRDQLYNGDNRVASLFLWHYVEEIEHRSSAEIIFAGVVGRPWYQLRMLPRSFAHVARAARTVAEGIEKAVPADEMGGVDVQAATSALWRTELVSRVPLLKRRRTERNRTGYRTMFDGIPGRQLMRLIGGLLLSQWPPHHPGDVRAPQWYDTWMAAHAGGEDMAHFYGTPATVR